MEKSTAFLLLAGILFGITDTVMSKAYGCNDIDSSDFDECVVTAEVAGYNGPASFEEIFAGKPTKPAQYSDELTENLWEANKSLISGLIGSIPVVGSLLNGIFGALTPFFGGPGWQTAVEQLYADLAQEVQNLKLYVDGAIIELTVDIARANLGGLYRAVDNCRLYTDADDMVACVFGTRSIILADWEYFMAPIPYGTPNNIYNFPFYNDLLRTVTELEYILPMWRVYGDLLIGTGLEQICSERHAGDDDQAIVFAAALIADIDEMLTYYGYARKIIQIYSASLGVANRRVCEIHQGSGCCITGHVFDQGEWTAEIGPVGARFRCKTVHRVGCKKAGSYDEASDDARADFYDAYLHFSKLREEALDNYYGAQFGTTLANWTAVATAYGSIQREVKIGVLTFDPLLFTI